MKDVEVEIFAFLGLKIFEDLRLCDLMARCYSFLPLVTSWDVSKIRQQKVYICVMFENTFNKCMEEYLLGVVILGEKNYTSYIFKFDSWNEHVILL